METSVQPERRVSTGRETKNFQGSGPFGLPVRTHHGEGVPWYLKPDKKIWEADTKLPKTHVPLVTPMKREQIDAWVDSVLPKLDAPEVLVPEMNCVVRPWDKDDPEHKKCRFLIQTPVEYSAAIANMGVAIVYDILNNRDTENCIAERVYYPEPKLKKLMLKRGVPLFSKETRTSVREFDIIGVSSYYPLQMLAIPELLELGGMSPYTDERLPTDPLVGLCGVSAFNPAPVWNMVDFVAIGEGEDQVFDMVRIWQEEKYNSWEHAHIWQGPKSIWTEETFNALSFKDRVLLRWTTETDGVYVPKWYEELYYEAADPKHPGELKAHRVLPSLKGFKGPNGKSLPEKIRKAIIDVNKVKPLTKMFVSNSEGEAMSAGSLMIANSCSNKCYFCQGSYVSQPYRERDIEMLKTAFSELIKETGAHAVTPYSFNLSDHSKINDLVFHLMNDENRKVSMSSQRIDYFSPDFARAAFLSGNKSITLAVEGGSQRMRDVISKNLTDAMILEAFRTVFEIGFQRVKIYMIANLPGEHIEDRFAIVDLLRRIYAIQREVQGDTPTTQIRVSYTPFTAKNFTPFQWAPSLECEQETGLPVIEKNLSEVIEQVHDLGYKFRVGTNSDLSIFNQLITHGDRRMAPVMMAVYRSTSLNYAGGMSIGKNPLYEVQTYLHNMGFDFEYFMREKPLDEVFPWDFINIRVTKRFLADMWERSQNEQNVAVCFDDCTKCGACTPESKEHFDSRKDGSLPPDRSNVSDALNYKPKPVLQKLRLRFRVLDKFRFVHGSKIKMRLRRAALRIELPIKNEFTLASDKIVHQNWLAGTDYAEVALHSRVFDEVTLAKRLTDACQGAIEVFEARVLTSNAGNFRTSFEKVLYEMEIPSAIVDTGTVQKLFRETLAAKSVIVRLKVKGMMKDSWQVISYEARPAIHSLRAYPTPSGTKCLMVLSDKLGPYELLPAVFKTSKRNLLQFVARRVDLLETAADSSSDMFSASCDTCGRGVESNLFGDSISDSRCSQCISPKELQAA
ncbi:radical SAM protein [Candidatus Parcubacteria bacterium]|nr:radical SAM protein [Candidatus Parcubacteria bacterium]